ncbi:TolB family protein [Tessaracoccus sp. Y1736]
MRTDDGGLSRFEHDEMRDLVLAGTERIRPAGTRTLRAAGAGVALLLVGAVAGAFLTWTVREPDSPAAASAIPAPTTTLWSGWVAFAAGERGADIYLVKQGSPARRILGSEADDADQICPAFSPDGRRLVSGQVTGEDDAGGVVASLNITDLTADGEPTRTTSLTLDGVVHPPCAVWSSDGRWLAFGADLGDSEFGVTQVWVVDTKTNDITRLPGLRATDLEWAPRSSELFIASGRISIYSAETGTTRSVDGTSRATALAISPDGRSLVVQYGPGRDAPGSDDLVLMGTDGSNQRTLVAGYQVGNGIGPVWSPDGDHVAFQRSCDTYVDEAGQERICLDEHEAVVVTVGGDDPRTPFGTQTVIPAPQTTHGGKVQVWAPYSVSWSPDGKALLYIAWSYPGYGILAVPVDSSSPPVVLDDVLGVGGHIGQPWNTFQSWSTQGK